MSGAALDGRRVGVVVDDRADLRGLEGRHGGRRVGTFGSGGSVRLSCRSFVTLPVFMPKGRDGYCTTGHSKTSQYVTRGTCISMLSDQNGHHNCIDLTKSI